MKQDASVPQHHYITKLHRLWQTGALPREVGLQWKFSLAGQADN